MNGSPKMGILLAKAQSSTSMAVVRPWSPYGGLIKEEAGKQIQSKVCA